MGRVTIPGQSRPAWRLRPRRMRPAGHDDGRASEEDSDAAAVRPEPHQGIAGQPDCLSRRRHVLEYVLSPPGSREPVKVSQAEHGG